MTDDPKCPSCGASLQLWRRYRGTETRPIVSMSTPNDKGLVYIEVGDEDSDEYTDIDSDVVTCSKCEWTATFEFEVSN